MELAADTDVKEIIGKVKGLHTVPLELSLEVFVENQYSILYVEFYPDVESSLYTPFCSRKTRYVLSCRGPTKPPSSYIFTRSGAEITTLWSDWLINKCIGMPSINIQQYAQN